jgi:hypothetical protein
MAAGLVLFFAGGADAQTPPPQTPSSPPPPIQDPLSGRTVQTPPGVATTPEVRDEPWSFSLGVNGSYEGNALFLGPSDDNELSHTVNASIGRSWRLRRGDAQLGATAIQPFYQDSTDLNDFRYSVIGGFGQAITRRLNWSGSFSVSSGLARDSQVLTDAGAVLPSTASARTSTGSSVFSYALSPKAHVTWMVASSGVGFSSVAFNGGNIVNSAATYTRQVGNAQSLGATAEYVHTFSEDLSSNVYGLLGVWTLSAGRGWTISASAGVRPYDVPSEEGLRSSLALNAGVTKPLRRTQAIGVTYGKSVEQAFGLHESNNLVQTLTANYSMMLHPKVSASISGTLTQAKDPLNTDSSSIGQVAAGSIGYRILHNLGMSFGSSFYRRKIGSTEGSTSSTTYVSLTYNTTFR